MIKATNLKGGATFLFEAKPYQVIKYELVKIGRGGAVVRLRVRNLASGGVATKTFSSNVVLDEVSTTKRKLQYLYKDAKNAAFMDPATYEQVEIPLSILAESASFLKEGESLDVLFWDEKPLSVLFPSKVAMKVFECDPGVRGNSATNIYKPAVLENGLKLKVPLFINPQDTILVDTRTGEYLERINKQIVPIQENW